MTKSLITCFLLFNIAFVPILQPMAATVEVASTILHNLTHAKTRPYPPLDVIGEYRCDKTMIKLKKWLEGDSTKDPFLYNRCMFSNTPYEEVAAFVEELARDAEGLTVIDFDFRGDPRLLDKRSRDAIQQAIDSYEETGQPAILHIHHTSSVPMNDSRDSFGLGFFQECEIKTSDEDPSFLLVYSIEDSPKRICGDIIGRARNFLQIKGNFVYDVQEQRRRERIQLENRYAYVAKSFMVGGATSALVASLYLTKFVLSLRK